MNQDLLYKILRSPRLPSLPTIALEVIDLVQKQDVDIKQIANTIQLDPALSSKILKTVNSSFYGQAYAISTISHALVVLGLNSVKTLALGFSLVANLKDHEHDPETFDHVDYWKRSIYTATAARQLAQTVGVIQQEEAFLGGLFQNLGMLAMNCTLGEKYQALLAATAGDHERLLVLEQDRLDMDHAEVGAALAEAWHLPPLLVNPIRFHHDPDAAPDNLRQLVQCTALGANVAELFVCENNGRALEAFTEHAENWFGLARADAEPLLRDIHRKTNEMARLFELPTGELGHPDEILARANEALERLTLQSHQQTTELKQANAELARQANTDPLTGAANRGRFNTAVVEAFDHTAATRKPVSLLLFDADHFKKFNDTFGHPTGDRVLIELATTVTGLLPEGGLAARYGGEEFAVIVPGCDRKCAAVFAEKVRVAIERMTVASDEGQPLSVTASIGVATYDGTFFQRVEQWIKAADKGVYAAKAAGRNCVRIFTPAAQRAA